MTAYRRIKRKNSELYNEQLKDINGIEFISYEPEGCYSNKWFYTIYIDKEEYGLTRDELIEKLISQNIQVRPVWKLNHQQMKYTGYQSYKIENAYEIYDSAINIPCSVNLKSHDIEYISEIIRQK